MNLMTTPWIPVHRQHGEDRIAPWQITEADNSILALAAPRADFNGALIQFLIGLLQTACPPSDGEHWARWLECPPAPDTLRQHFQAHAHAFELEGEGACFLQDLEPISGEERPIANLLIEAPGAQALRQNTDHFIKRGRVESLCPACAAMALLTLQTNAPGGGAGHRTSLRGGGPLTTLVALDPDGGRLADTLWRACWLNVLEGGALGTLTGGDQRDRQAGIFPWLAPTRTSEAHTGIGTTPLDVHSLQMYWGMPRRIRINWNDVRQGVCDLCNASSKRLVSRYVTRNYGINYIGAWEHTLSPYLTIDQRSVLPRHAQPGGINYRHWLGLISETETSRPARVVGTFLKGGRKLPEDQFRLRSFGYDMDNMKARCWYEATFPLYPLDDTIRATFTARAGSLIQAATESASFMRGCIKEAWFSRPGDARGDTAFLVEAFLKRTEHDFYTSLQRLREELRRGGDGLTVLWDWPEVLHGAALHLFDYWTSRGDFEAGNPRRVAKAHHKLNNWFRGKTLRNTLKLAIGREQGA